MDLIERFAFIYDEISENTDVYNDEIELLNNEKRTIGNYYCDIIRELEESSKSAKTSFLIIPIISSFIKRIKPYYKVTIEEVMSGAAQEKAEHLQKFMTDLEKSKINHSWIYAKEKINANINAMGLPINEIETERLENVYPAIKNALTFLEKSKINKIQKGNHSKSSAKIIPYISLHKSESDFAAVMKAAACDSFVTFAAIRPTNGMVEDKMNAYIHNREGDELIRNWMMHTGKSAEEIRNMPYEYGRSFVIGIRNGENIWLISTSASIPGNYKIRDDYSDFFLYGERWTYIPLQAFFHDDEPQREQTTEIKVIRDGYWIRDLIDSHQAVWMATLVSEIKQRFFDPEKADDLEQEKTYGDRVKIILHDQNDLVEHEDEIYLPQVYRHECHVSLETLGLPCEEMELLHSFGISLADIQGTPYQTRMVSDQESIDNAIKNNIRSILGKLLATRIIEETYNHVVSNRDEYRSAILSRREDIIHLLAERDMCLYDSTTINVSKEPYQIRMNGEPCLDENGQKIKAKSLGVYAGRENSNEIKFFIPETLQGKTPPVYMIIEAQNADAALALIGKNKADADMKLLTCFYDLIIRDQQINNETESFSLMNTPGWNVTVKNAGKIKTIKYLFRVCICMGKRELKKLLNL